MYSVIAYLSYGIKVNNSLTKGIQFVSCQNVNFEMITPLSILFHLIKYLMEYFYSTHVRACLFSITIFLLPFQLFAQSNLVNIEVRDKQHFQITRYETMSVPYRNKKMSMPYTIIIEGGQNNRTDYLVKDEVLRYSLDNMNENTVLRIKLEERTVKNIRNNLFSSLLGDIALIGLIQYVIDVELAPDAELDIKKRGSSYNKTKQKLKEFVREEIKEKFKDILDRQIDETFEVIDKWEAMLAASNGVNNKYYEHFTPINIFDMVKGSGVRKSGANTNWFFDVGWSFYKKDLGDRWSQKASGIKNISLEFVFARNIISKDLGNDLSLGLYGFVGYEIYKHQLNNDAMDVFVSRENINGATEDFHPLTSNEGVILWNNQASIGAIIQLYKYRSFFSEIGAGWNVFQRSNIQFDDKASDDTGINHLASGLSLTDDKIKDVTKINGSIYGLAKIGYLYTTKDKNDRNYGWKIFVSGRFWNRDMTPNENYPLYRQVASQGGIVTFEKLPVSEDDGLFYIISAGVGFSF